MKKSILLTLSFCLGSALLCFLATFQKMSIGAPLVLKGYIVPFSFGGTAGLLLGLWIFRLKEARLALQKSYAELEVRVDERTLELRTEVEERKQIEQELRDSEIKYRSLSEASFEGIIITEKGRILEVNSAVERISGFNQSELIGKDAVELVTHEEKEKVLNKMSTAYEGSYESIGLRKDGSTFPIEIQAKMFSFKNKQARVAAVRDLTARKQAEEEIKLLQGILPICASCKKIRDDKGYWKQIESYIRKHSEADFTHCICPDCAKKLYPDFVDENGNF